MSIIIKQAIRIGNSSGVILPKKWENRKVRVELIEDSIIRDIFEIVKKRDLLRETIGIYLFGSYARGEETDKSDIDILIVTGNFAKSLKEGNYDIFFISREKLEKNLDKNLYLYSIVKEAKVIFNRELIEEYKDVKFDLKLSEKLKEIKNIMDINWEFVKIDEEEGEKVADGTVYSVVLRLRELFLIDCILNGRRYSNKAFLRLIEEKGSLELYEAYNRIKNDKMPRKKCEVSDVKGLMIYMDRLLKELKNSKKKKKA